MPVNGTDKARGSTRRSGYVMVLFAMLLFGIMAMAALVIDIGFARLAQRQMQSAADSGALEGLRFRDQLPPEPQSEDLDEARRLQARKVVSQLFDDNLLEDETDSFNFGAGPVVKFQASTSNGGVYANEFIFDPENPSSDPKIGSLPKVPIYKPVLETNITNRKDGDMVAGGNYNATNDHGENEFYDRQDFDPNDPANDVFLVRMRRTGESFEPGVGTSGPRLPYLFARGSLMFDVDENSSDDPRRLIDTGIKVRATSIATLQPVVCVGDKNVDLDIPGKLDVAVPLLDWQAEEGTTFLKYDNNAIGGEVDANIPGEPNGTLGYVAIYDPDAGNRVIGFGPASITAGRFNLHTPFETPNASAVFCYPFQSSSADDHLVFKSRKANRDVLYQVPVSVR